MVLQEIGEGAIKVGKAIGEGAAKVGSAINRGISTAGQYLKGGLGTLYNKAREYIPKISDRLGNTMARARMALQSYLQDRALRNEQEQLQNLSQDKIQGSSNMPAIYPVQQEMQPTSPTPEVTTRPIPIAQPVQYPHPDIPVEVLTDRDPSPISQPRSVVVFLFDNKDNTISETLGEFDTAQEAEREVSELRKQGLPAFYATKGEYISRARLKA